MRLTYALHDAGWATVTVECGPERAEMSASYLHDSLRDLASGARALASGASEVRVIFMDEPGEHELVLRRAPGDVVAVEIWWHDDWKSWGIGPRSGGTRKLSGSTTVAHVRGQVLSELRRLLRENGETGYREKWGEHDFPTEQLRQLEEAV